MLASELRLLLCHGVKNKCLFLPALNSTCLPCSQCLTQKRNFAKDRRTYYEVLEIPETASPAEIKAAFVRLSKKLHPDINVNDPKLHDKFVALNKAYSVLNKPQAKKEYDITLQYGKSYPGFGPYSTTSQRETQYNSQYDYMRHDPTFWKPNYKFPNEHYNSRENNKKGVYMWLALIGLGCLYCFASYRIAKNQVEKLRVKQVNMMKDLEEGRASRQLRFYGHSGVHNNIVRTLDKPSSTSEKYVELNKMDRASVE